MNKLFPGKGTGARLLEAFAASSALVSVAVVALGFLVATVLLLLIGRNPAGMYEAIVQVVSGFDIRPGRGGWNPRHIGEWVMLSSPLILCGLSMAFAFRTGLFNIGAEGQYIVGLTFAQIMAHSFPPIPALHQIVAVSSGVMAGAIWGGIVGFFKARYRVSEVVATIMMNYIALFGHRVITLRLPGALPHRTPDFPQTATLASPILSALTNGSRLNHALWLTIAAVVAYWLIMEKTKLGYSLRATGFNRDAALYGGINVKANITAAMGIAGGFAGLAGATVALGLFGHGWVLQSFIGYGFEGIAVALVGNSTALGVALAGLLFGMLRSAQPIMQIRQIPMEITSIIVGLVVIFISLRAGMRLLIDKRMKERVRREKEEDA
ncbi:MAG: ABC transporter permease [Treponema sp.]|nr:ABC transporter permease [Treponema sp.]